MKKELEGNTNIQGTRKPKLFDWFLLRNGYKIPLILKSIGFTILLLIASFISFKVVQYFFPDRDTLSIIVAIIIFIILMIALTIVLLGVSSIIFILIKPEKLIDKISDLYAVWRILNYSYDINGKFYSLWYIILFKKDININCRPKNFSHKDINLFDDMVFYKYEKLLREKRKHWTNSIKTNQILSFKDYCKLIRNKKKIDKINKINADVEKFQKYYNLK